MTNVFNIFAAVVLLFFILFIAKELFRRKTRICLICASVSITWITLLALYFKGHFDNVVILSMLMGQSIVGIFYLLEKKTSEKLHLFKVPFLLTLTFIFYLLIDVPDDFIKVLILLGALWFALIVLFFFRKSDKVGRVVKKLIECCKRW